MGLEYSLGGFRFGRNWALMLGEPDAGLKYVAHGSEHVDPTFVAGLHTHQLMSHSKPIARG